MEPDIQVLRDLWVVRWGDRPVYESEINNQNGQLQNIGYQLLLAGVLVSGEVRNRVYYTLTKE